MVVDMLGTAFEMAIVGAMLVCPFLGLFYSWSQWQVIFKGAELSPWRRAVGVLGLFAITIQAVSFIALWTPISRYQPFLALTVPIGLFLLWLTVLSIFFWNGSVRWWLLASSLLLFVDSFLVVLAELAY